MILLKVKDNAICLHLNNDISSAGTTPRKSIVFAMKYIYIYIYIYIYMTSNYFFPIISKDFKNKNIVNDFTYMEFYK